MVKWRVMFRPIRLGVTKEEKVAKSIERLLSDFSLDLDMVGFYIANTMPYVIYARTVEVLESAEYNKNSGKEIRRVGMKGDSYYND